jgi:hypothetical protein
MFPIALNPGMNTATSLRRRSESSSEKNIPTFNRWSPGCAGMTLNHLKFDISCTCYHKTVTNFSTVRKGVLRMNHLLFFCLSALVILGIGCAEFPTSYNRIEPEKPRLLDFIYEPAEAAPGDTVLLTAVFAGKPVSASDLSWEASWDIMTNEYGYTVATDTVPLATTPVDGHFSDNTSTVSFTFIVPDDIIEKSNAVPDNWTEAIPEYYREAIPRELRQFSRADLLRFITMAAASSNSAANSLLNEETKQLLPILLQCFTVPVQLHCSVKGGHRIVSDYSVRYNSRFSTLPQAGIPVNRNPAVDSIRVYAVKKNPLTFFDPATCSYPFSWITVTGDTTVLNIDKNNSYFIGVFTGNLDTTLSIDAALGNGEPLPEQHYIQWYEEFDQKELDEVAPSDLLQISGDDVTDGQHIAHLYPSLDHAITGCIVWCEVWDQFMNELYRPHGSTLREMVLRFEYEDN